MKKMTAFLLALTFMLAFAGCTVTEPQQKTLTLEKVKKLAEKGEDLSWNDFEQYDHEDVGSGLHIYRYDIDENYCLFIGGGSTQETPMYVQLVYRTNAEESFDTGAYIDIRTESIDNFINGFKE